MKILDSFRNEISKCDFENELKERFLQRIKKGNLSLEENPLSHFCVSFLAYDPSEKMVFVGFHKRSGLWMFNGGHIEKGESIKDALEREMEEEWGDNSLAKGLNKPSFLTITPVTNAGDRKCKIHYGIWYFIPVNRDEFNPDRQRILEEYIEEVWKTVNEAKKLIIVPNYLLILDKIKEMF